MAKEKSAIAMVLTRYEKASIIGSRSLQIAMGAPLQIKLSPEELTKIKYSPIKLAIKEYDAGVIPITIKRPKAKVR